MIVGMWMTRQLLTVGPETRLSEAAALMTQNRIRRLPVTRQVGDEVRLLGLVSATDLYRAYPPDRNPFGASAAGALQSDQPVESIMSRNLRTTTADTPVEDAARIMRDEKIGALPVMRDSVLAGLITESDIFRAFISILEADASATRVTFKISDTEDAFQQLATATRGRDAQILSLISSRRDGHTACVVRMTGADVDQIIDGLWKSGHQVLNVLRWPTS